MDRKGALATMLGGGLMSSFGFGGGQSQQVTDLSQMSPQALGQLRLWLEQHPPATHITNVMGFAQFAAKTAFIFGGGTISGSVYGDLNDKIGPQISGLSAGRYLFLFGAAANCVDANVEARVTIVSADGKSLAADDSNSFAIAPHVTVSQSGMGFAVAELKSDSNTVVMKYRQTDVVNPHTVAFNTRKLAAFRYANI